jgi:STE24 endopeptidase
MTSIDQLAAFVNFPRNQIFAIDSSIYSGNAFCISLWGKEQKFLMDTFFANGGQGGDGQLAMERGCTNEKILAIVAHELGHWKFGHSLKGLLFTEFQLFLNIILFCIFLEYEVLYQAMGLPEGEKPIVIGLLVVFTYVLAPCNTLILFLKLTS